MVNSCKKTTELIDKKFIATLTLKERIQLFFHKSMCKTCTSYEHQSKVIDSAVSNLLHDNSEINAELPQERKQKIIDKINES